MIGTFVVKELNAFKFHLNNFLWNPSWNSWEIFPKKIVLPNILIGTALVETKQLAR